MGEVIEMKAAGKENAVKHCIFGPEINQMCNVRREIEGAKENPLEKYIKGPAQGVVLSRDIQEMLTHMADMVSKINNERTQLAAFCVKCPFVQIYINKVKRLGTK